VKLIHPEKLLSQSKVALLQGKSDLGNGFTELRYPLRWQGKIVPLLLGREGWWLVKAKGFSRIKQF